MGCCTCQDNAQNPVLGKVPLEPDLLMLLILHLCHYAAFSFLCVHTCIFTHPKVSRLPG